MKSSRRKVKHIRGIAALLMSLLLTVPLLSGAQALNVTEPYGDEPSLMTEGALLYDVNTRQILMEKNMHEKLYPASTTKLMTALLTLENCTLDETVTVAQEAYSTVPAGSSIAGLRAGEELTVRSLLICLLVPSGNDAANALAVHVGGSIAHFVEMMNDRAAELGCQDTHFVNAHGYHDPEHYTSAYDLLLITMACREYDVFNEIVGSEQMSIPPTNKYTTTRYFNNTNYLLSASDTSAYLYEYATGIKTGHTTEAGRCLVASAEKGGRTLIAIVLNAPTNYTVSGVRQIMSFWEAKDLFDWGFDYFSYKTVVNVGDMVAEVPVAMGDGKDFVTIHPAESFTLLLHRSMGKDTLQYQITHEESVDAPVKKDQVLGQMTVSYNGETLTTIDLVATYNVEQSRSMFIRQELRTLLQMSGVRLMVAALVAVIVLYIVYLVKVNQDRKRRLAQRKKARQTREYR